MLDAILAEYEKTVRVAYQHTKGILVDLWKSIVPRAPFA